MTARILTEFKQQITSFELEPSRGGCFELTVNNGLVYSKLATGQFPDEEEMVAAVRNRMK
ncbi:MAG: SelT/SelW/SelH family protein [Planctomycetes bacterium]|nr:SelT/SelW/SelH family protein [Planctomycetota bacterium]